MTFYITKASGEKERFNLKKFRRSLKKAGAAPELINNIVEHVAIMRPQSTREIYQYALSQLHKKDTSVAARYNLKEALIELGPAGFPFEKFIAHLLQAQGYTTKTNQIVHGTCVWHEVDIVAIKKNSERIIECKFHHRGVKSDVKVALYNKARFDDIYDAWKKNNNSSRAHSHLAGWVVTNTKFTSIATQYAECVGLKLLSWTYPDKESLPALIDALGLHPITALTSLNRSQKRAFIQQGFVLCRDALRYKGILRNFGFSERKINRLIAQATDVCRIEENALLSQE